MMRVAVAGTCGLARRIARSIINDTSHTVVLLSRSVSFILSTNPTLVMNSFGGAIRSAPSHQSDLVTNGTVRMLFYILIVIPGST